MKQPLLTLLCLNDSQITTKSMKYAKLNSILGLVLIVCSVALYKLELKPMFDELSVTLESTAKMISKSDMDSEFNLTSELLLMCSDFTRVSAMDISLVLSFIGFFMLFTGLMYYRFNTLYGTLNK